MNNNQRKLQIGVMGSAADLQYGQELERQAEELGYWIATQGATLIFGAEKDYDSLSAAACRGAKRAGGSTVGITYGKGLEVYEKNADVIIASGLERGGGRELALVLSCDAIIAISGGSGTLNEITIAYQANIPIVALAKSGGWSEQLASQFLDARQRVRIESAATPEEAVVKAISLARGTFFVGGVHGDETIGVNALQQLEQEGIVSPSNWIIGNPRAFEKGTRCVAVDLNRVFPGNDKGRTYEEKRAWEIIQKAQKFRYVVDIHGTEDDTGIFVIVSNPTEENMALARKFDVQNIVIWPSTSGRETGPLNQFVQCGVELECGPQTSPQVQVKLLSIMRKYLAGNRPLRKQKYFRVYGALEKYSGKRPLKSFRLATVTGECFYPLLVGRYSNIACYQMKQAITPRL